VSEQDRDERLCVRQSKQRPEQSRDRERTDDSGRTVAYTFPLAPVGPIRSHRPLRLQTYKNFAYLWFAFPLGIVYFTALVTAFSLSIGLLVAVLVLNLSNGIARLWARYTRYMLGARNTTDSATR
jgi:hypothetical protein